MIIYKRSVKFPIQGSRRVLNADIEEKFSKQEHFINWYNDNHEVPIDRAIAPKFVSAVRAGETICAFTDTGKNKVEYIVRS